MQQALFPLHLVTVGVSVAWLFRLVNQNNPPPKPKGAGDAGDMAAANESSLDADLERSATQWLARSGGGPESPACAEHTTSSYAELELLAEGDFVYLRSGTSVLAALVPPVRHLTFQPLQLAKGKPGAVPTAPLESISVWLVRRCKQEVIFELLGPHDRRHILEADPSAPHGVALSGGSPGKRGRWLITPQGLSSARWPFHVLPLQVLTAQLFDARAIRSVRDGLGHKLTELATKCRQEEFARAQAEEGKAELQRERNEAESRIAELRAQLEAAMIARHAAEREAAAMQGLRADEAVRAKMAQARATQAESEAQLAVATVRRQEQQIQGLLAEHAEELRTLQQELQIARETKEGLKRAMREQVLSLQGALELRDARILELEEENDRMDTVLQVIQAQLGGGFAVPGQRYSSAGGAAPESDTRAAVGARAEIAGAGAAAAAVDKPVADDAGGCEPGKEPSLSAILEAPVEPNQQEHQLPVPAGPSVVDEPPLWRSLLDVTGDLSVTALKESLAMSRRNTVDDAPTPSVVREPQRSPPRLQPTDGVSEAVCGVAAGARAAAGDWGSGGGEGSGGGAASGEEEFVSAAARMSGHVRLTGGATATPLRQQQPQVPGGIGGDVGLPSAARADPAGAGADAAARRGSSGGTGDGDAVADTVLAGASRSAALPSAAAVAAAPGCSTAELEYGMEATLTLDSLRRRMRQLEAERQRLELLRVSLEGSLPWRTGVSVVGAGGDAGCVRRGALHAALRSCGGATASTLLEGRLAVGLTAAAGGEQSGQDQLVNTGTTTTTCGQQQQHGSQASLRQEQRESRQQDSMRDQLGKAMQSGELERQAAAGGLLALQRGSPLGGAPQACRGRPTAAQWAPYPVGSPGCARAAGSVASPIAGQQHQRKTDGGSISNRSPAVACRPPFLSTSGAVAACSGSPAASPGSGARVRCIAPQLLSHGSRCSSEARVAVLLDSEAAVAAASPRGDVGACSDASSYGERVAANEPDPEESLTFSCSSSGGRSGDSNRSQQGDGETACDVATGTVCVAVDVWKCGLQDKAAPTAVPSTEGWAAAADGPLTAPALLATGNLAAAALTGLRLPVLAFDGRPAPRVEVPCGPYDSIDGLCNLGSTRALPTARGAGWQSARRVGHSRQPSAGVVAAEALPPLPGAAAVATPRDALAQSPAQLPSHRAAAITLAAAAAGTPPESLVGVATPKSCASATTCGGGDFALMDDDAMVHCDDQETPSPPPAMLLGPLDQLRGAAAAVAAAAASDSGVVRRGSWVRSALEEDDEAY